MNNHVYDIYKKYIDYLDKDYAEKKAKEEWLELVNKVGKPLSEFTKNSCIVSFNKYDTGLTYFLSESPGTNLTINAAYSPAEMLKLGVFEGKYLNDDIYEFPKEWFIDAADSLSILRSDVSKNCMSGHDSRLGLSEWVANGWIKEDKKGWFQWYCRMWLGRRSEDDAHQSGRHRAFNRHAGQVRANCEPGNLNQRPRQRQGLLQWSYKYDI